MELREIATFLQAAQLKSFSRAARELGYSQAAVTIQIKQLEKELGVHLFDRLGKQTTLTRQGELFFAHASTVMRELALAREALAEGSELTGTLCLGTIESICASILPQLLERFHALHPQVNVRVVIDSPETLLEMMNSNTVDIVYFLDRRMYDHKWIKVLEEPEEAVFTASSGHPLAGREHLTLDEILNEPFLLTEPNASYRFILDQYLAAHGKSLRPFLEIGNTEFIIRSLPGSANLSFLPRFAVLEELKAGRLCALEVEKFRMRIWRQVVYHRDKWVTREMEAFFKVLGKSSQP